MTEDERGKQREKRDAGHDFRGGMKAAARLKPDRGEHPTGSDPFDGKADEQSLHQQDRRTASEKEQQNAGKRQCAQDETETVKKQMGGKEQAGDRREKKQQAVCSSGCGIWRRRASPGRRDSRRAV